jgi:hypothetical protein
MKETLDISFRQRKKFIAIYTFLLFIFINTTYIIKFSIYLCSEFYLSFRALICFINPNHAQRFF